LLNYDMTVYLLFVITLKYVICDDYFFCKILIQIIRRCISSFEI